MIENSIILILDFGFYLLRIGFDLEDDRFKALSKLILIFLELLIFLFLKILKLILEN